MGMTFGLSLAEPVVHSTETDGMKCSPLQTAGGFAILKEEEEEGEGKAHQSIKSTL